MTSVKPNKPPASAAPPPDFKGPAREYWARVKVVREAKQAWASAPRVAVDSFKTDPLFPRIERAVAAILASGKVVAPIDVLTRMDLLKPEDVENWRFGRIAYLERVIHCNLTKLGRILRILRMHAHDLKLTPSQTAYVRWGKHGHRAPLQFSKTGEAKLEEAYSRHDAVFFADEAGSWQVGVDWRATLPAYFACVAASAELEEFARLALAAARDFADYDRGKLLTEARRVASKEQKAALRKLTMQKLPQR